MVGISEGKKKLMFVSIYKVRHLGAELMPRLSKLPPFGVGRMGHARWHVPFG